MALATEEHKPADAAPAAVPKLLKPYLIVSGYYGAIGGVLALVLVLQPSLLQFLPVGGAASFGAVGESAFEPVNRTLRPTDSTLVEGVKLALSIVSAFLLMLPVTWICMGARKRKDVSQSFIQTILVLPMVITGIVHVVHNSLALAFSLAGIVAGVRFRHTLKDSAETTYLFTAIGVGVACGINAVEVAAIISIFFNYTVLGLCATEFGAESTGKQMFSREWMAKEEARPHEGKHKQKHEDDDDD
ncbi:MAG TPA: DUF4956 domain-containing protein [Terricaulis sp.]|nr:DUF4956 domain-containing protein [Terricaulis sp.]